MAERQISEITEPGKAYLLTAGESVAESDQFVGTFVVWLRPLASGGLPPGAIPHPSEEGFLLGFSPTCTHMGCLLVRKDGDPTIIYSRNGDDYLTCGPCPCHGTSFDLLKAGLVILGPATQNLAQLELGLSEDKSKVHALRWVKNEQQDIDPREEVWPYQSKD